MTVFLAILSVVLFGVCLFLLFVIGKVALERNELEEALNEANTNNETLIGLCERANVRYFEAKKALETVGFGSINGNEDVH